MSLSGLWCKSFAGEKGSSWSLTMRPRFVAVTQDSRGASQIVKTDYPEDWLITSSWPLSNSLPVAKIRSCTDRSDTFNLSTKWLKEGLILLRLWAINAFRSKFYFLSSSSTSLMHSRVENYLTISERGFFCFSFIILDPISSFAIGEKVAF